jgi:hypothetical protein
VQEERPARLEHPDGLAHGPVALAGAGDVVEDVHAVGEVEARVGIRERAGIGHLEVDPDPLARDERARLLDLALRAVAGAHGVPEARQLRGVPRVTAADLEAASTGIHPGAAQPVGHDGDLPPDHAVADVGRDLLVVLGSERVEVLLLPRRAGDPDDLPTPAQEPQHAETQRVPGGGGAEEADSDQRRLALHSERAEVQDHVRAGHTRPESEQGDAAEERPEREDLHRARSRERRAQLPYDDPQARDGQAPGRERRRGDDREGGGAGQDPNRGRVEPRVQGDEQRGGDRAEHAQRDPVQRRQEQEEAEDARVRETLDQPDVEDPAARTGVPPRRERGAQKLSQVEGGRERGQGSEVELEAQARGERAEEAPGEEVPANPAQHQVRGRQRRDQAQEREEERQAPGCDGPGISVAQPEDRRRGAGRHAGQSEPDEDASHCAGVRSPVTRSSSTRSGGLSMLAASSST